MNLSSKQKEKWRQFFNFFACLLDSFDLFSFGVLESNEEMFFNGS